MLVATTREQFMSWVDVAYPKRAGHIEDDVYGRPSPFDQRESAAFRAIAFRFFAGSFFALAFPPARPPFCRAAVAGLSTFTESFARSPVDIED